MSAAAAREGSPVGGVSQARGRRCAPNHGASTKFRHCVREDLRPIAIGGREAKSLRHTLEVDIEQQRSDPFKREVVERTRDGRTGGACSARELLPGRIFTSFGRPGLRRPSESAWLDVQAATILANSLGLENGARRARPFDIRHSDASLTGWPSLPREMRLVRIPEDFSNSVISPTAPRQFPRREGWSISDGQDGSTICGTCSGFCENLPSWTITAALLCFKTLVAFGCTSEARLASSKGGRPHAACRHRLHFLPLLLPRRSSGDDASGFRGFYKQRAERCVFETKPQQSLDFSACDPSAKRRRNNIDLACAQRSINRWSAASQNRSCLRD